MPNLFAYCMLTKNIKSEIGGMNVKCRFAVNDDEHNGYGGPQSYVYIKIRTETHNKINDSP